MAFTGDKRKTGGRFARRVIPVVTGLGVMAPNGNNAEEFFRNCQSGKTGIRIPEAPLSGTEKLRTECWGQMDEIPGYREEFDGNVVYRSMALAKRALEEALSDAGLSVEAIAALGERAAFVTGALSYDDYAVLEAVRYMETAGEKGALSYLKEEPLSLYLREVCGVRGGCYNFSPACASGTVAVAAAMELIRSGRCDVVLVCGVDALSKTVAYGFHSLKALSCGMCHPLDQRRDGINIGEGCGVLVLEGREHALDRGTGVYAQCVSCALGNEAFHITSPSPGGEGFFDSMDTALRGASLSPDEVDYINLHGTGTLINDQAELTAVEKLYAGALKRPYLSSLKALTGHCMGAAGALEAVLAAQCLKYQQYFSLCGTDCPMEEIKDYQTRRYPIRYVLSNSFAFAGNTASVIFAGEDVEQPERISAETRDVFLNGIGILMPGISGIHELKGKFCQNGNGVRKQEDRAGWNPEGDEQGHTVAEMPTPGISAKKLRGMTKLSKMVLSAALQAEHDAGEDHAAWDAGRTGSVFSSRYGALKDRLRFGTMVEREKPELCSPTVFANVSPNAPLGHLCINMNCRKNSASMQGASPLLPAYMFVENGDCDRLFCCVAEEYGDVPAGEPYEGQPPYAGRDFCCQLFLQNRQSETSYCRIGKIITGGAGRGLLTGNPDESEREEFLKLADMCCRQAEIVPDAILCTGGTDFVCTAERQTFMENFPKSVCLSADQLFPGLGFESFYVNLSLAALCLKEGTMSPPMCGVDGRKPAGIMVTGYDICGNYYAVFLHSSSPL